MATQIEETLKRIQTSDGVIGFVIVNNAGIPIKSNMDDAMSVRYAGLVQQLIATSQTAIRKDDATDKLTYLRLRTKHNEIIVIPDKHYTMVVIQKPTGSRSPM
ncbi:dynein light chain roadblock-type 2-like isoform X1 [Myzus persicae]|uniref:dynein light chain roadblock-type 2-like isoform X1 n=1 Tax=Myzus persicae TaxID=13164 RepID=UPI000B939E65|nr:dynein light chain roadblock-type 2-like isoform X1 [Myzus persicae]XP_022172479.1 dynein light chain roadblock-type 2-like isoform X1 [Myzus persicae]